MAIQNRRGKQADFDPDKMLPGEWAVSMDTKYIYMCFSVGAVLRISTHEEFLAGIEEVRHLVEITDEKAEIANDKADEALDMKASLLGFRAILQGLDDSRGSPILDSSGGRIEGQVVFAELREVLELKRTVDAVAQYIGNLTNISLIKRIEALEKADKQSKTDISILEEHALLDSNYEQ